MKGMIFQMISLEKRCLNCTHFQNNPAAIEEAYPGLTAMSSGFSSVRDQDGICDWHDIYLSSRDSCPSFTRRQWGGDCGRIEDQF